jgi:hypothetical protein
VVLGALDGFVAQGAGPFVGVRASGHRKTYGGSVDGASAVWTIERRGR